MSGFTDLNADPDYYRHIGDPVEALEPMIADRQN
jgi:hypothetical protein